MNLADLEALMKSRRSIRAWQDKPVPEDFLLKAIELGTYAPNAGNQQNWKFYVITSSKIINAIADAVQESASYMAAWPEARNNEAASRMLQRASFFRNAPAAIAVATRAYQSPIDSLLAQKEKADTRAAQIRQWRASGNSGLQSVASAVANIILVLQQMGIGSVWMTGPLQAKGEIEKILKVPSDMNLTVFVPVGYPAENPPLKERKPVKEVVEIVK